MVHETLQIKASGGMLRADGSRRTLGGVSFSGQVAAASSRKEPIVARMFWTWLAGTHQ
jgi:hypothetical protein